MRLLDRLRNKVYEGIRNDLLGEDIQLETQDQDWKGLTDDMATLLTRGSELFVSGEIINLSTGQPADATANARFYNPNPWDDPQSILKRSYWLYKRYGVAYLYFFGDTWMVLENKNLNITYKNGVTIFNTTNFMELVDTLEYENNGETIDLIQQGGEIVPIYDIARSHNDFKPVSRVDQIKKTQTLAHAALDGLIGALSRLSMLMLAPKQGGSGVASYTPSQGTDGDIEGERKSLRKQLSLKKGAIGLLSRPMEMLQTNPDNGKLKALEALDKSAMNNCAMTSVPYKLLYGQTKFDDAALHLSLMYLGSMQPDSDKFFRVINSRLKQNPLAMDYSKQLDMLVKYTDTGKASTTNESSKTQTDE